VPRTCLACAHPQRDSIDAALIANQSAPTVGQQFSLSAQSVWRHRAHIAPAVLAVEQQRELTTREQLKLYTSTVFKLLAACDAWLTSPDDANAYDLSPRGEEIHVIIVEKHGRTTLRRKVPLTALLDQVAANGWQVERVENKAADTRELLIKAVNSLRSQVELTARLNREIDEPAVNVSVEIANIEARVINALAEYPEARQRVAAALIEGETVQ